MHSHSHLPTHYTQVRLNEEDKAKALGPWPHQEALTTKLGAPAEELGPRPSVKLILELKIRI